MRGCTARVRLRGSAFDWVTMADEKRATHFGVICDDSDGVGYHQSCHLLFDRLDFGKGYHYL